MSDIEITNMREFPRMVRPGFIETMIRVEYRTAKGYTGVVEIPKPIATPEKVKAEVKKAAAAAPDMVGEKLKV